MREILFRGKRVDNGEWVYGSLVKGVFFKSNTKENIPYILNVENIDYDSFEDLTDLNGYYEVTPETIGQYTGLKDKNRVKIFEHDRVSLLGWIGVVKFNLGAFYIDFLDGTESEFNTFDKSDIEIIGNIYDK